MKILLIPVALALALFLPPPDASTPRPAGITFIDRDGEVFASVNAREITPTVIHQGVTMWVLACMGMPKPARRIVEWRIAETIVGITPNVRGWQPLAVTQSFEDSTAVITFRQGWEHVNFVVSHELLHVITGRGDDDPRFTQAMFECQLRLPLRFGPMPVLPEDSVAKLEALGR